MNDTPMYESLSPAQIEQKLRQCVTELTRAEQQLRAARDSEVSAELAYRKAHRRALLAPDSPKVSRGGFTVTERDAWVEESCADQFEAYRLAQVTCQAAQDHVRTVRDIASTVQSISALVRQAFSMAGQS